MSHFCLKSKPVGLSAERFFFLLVPALSLSFYVFVVAFPFTFRAVFQLLFVTCPCESHNSIWINLNCLTSFKHSTLFFLAVVRKSICIQSQAPCQCWCVRQFRSNLVHSNGKIISFLLLKVKLLWQSLRSGKCFSSYFGSYLTPSSFKKRQKNYAQSEKTPIFSKHFKF